MSKKTQTPETPASKNSNMLVPALALIVIIGVIALSASGTVDFEKSLSFMDPLAPVIAVFCLVMIIWASVQSVRKHPVRTGIVVPLIIILTALATVMILNK